MTITPDGKDWTWVLERPCPECGLDTRGVAGADVPELLRRNVSGWAAVFAENDGDWLRTRPEPSVWSPLEYACHVRDVFRLYSTRLALMLDTDDPLYPNWDQDATAIEDGYPAQDPDVVVAELAAAGALVADELGAVVGAQWARPGRRSDGASFTVETFARYFVHDPVHHLHDVTG